MVKTYVYLWQIILMYGRNQHNIIKQLSSNKCLIKKINKEMERINNKDEY